MSPSFTCVAGVRMRYPTSYVLVPSESEKELNSRLGLGGAPHHPIGHGLSSMAPGGGRQMGMPLTPPTSPCDTALAMEISRMKASPSSGYRECHSEPDRALRDPSLTSRRVIQKVWQESCFCPQRYADGPDLGLEILMFGLQLIWDFAIILDVLILKELHTVCSILLTRWHDQLQTY